VPLPMERAAGGHARPWREAVAGKSAAADMRALLAKQ
jgi:hypothetical protein